jgi:hypothetical protein
MAVKKMREQVPDSSSASRKAAVGVVVVVGAVAHQVLDRSPVALG